MTSYPETSDHQHYRVPAVRHLAWMCHASQLISIPGRFDPAPYLSESTQARLQAWDADPDSGPGLLTETPARRLGHYFEQLYECLLRDLMGWNVLLKNQPVRSDGITLGELDFIVRNPVDQCVEHHEIAVKFYLGYQGSGQETPLWYGPNSTDRLDLKTDRLRHHQSRMTEKPEAKALLGSLGVPVPSKTQIFMPGYLFYPADQLLSSPANVPADHSRGQWMSIHDLDALSTGQTHRESGVNAWVPLQKPHWLGPWSQRQRPDIGQTEAALATVRSAGVPRLFAVLRESPADGLWTESSRVFVVPEGWPHR